MALRLERKHVKAFLEVLEWSEHYKPFQVVKRRVMARYGLLGSSYDRVFTAMLYRLYRMQGILDRVVAERTGLRPERLPAALRQALRLSALLALTGSGETRDFDERLVEGVARIIAARFGPSESRRVTGLYRGLLSRPWTPRDNLERMEFELMLPRIVIERLGRLLGQDGARRFAEAVNVSQPFLGLRVNRLKADVGEVLRELERAGVEAWPSERVPWHIVYKGSLNYSKFKPLIEGKAVPQDEASAAAGFILGARRGELVADLCAAPGGKTTHLAELSLNGAVIVALEIYPDRMARLVELAARTTTITSIYPVIGDALRASALLPRGRFDRALLDPPCSSTGAIAKHPDARWRLTEEGLARLVENQKRMLVQAVELLRPGGRLLYTTCSVLPEEGEEVVGWILQQRRDIEIVPLHGPYEESPILPGTMRSWPHKHGTTGFFYALLEKRL